MVRQLREFARPDKEPLGHHPLEMLLLELKTTIREPSRHD
jgi:hypothetical protein